MKIPSILIPIFAIAIVSCSSRSEADDPPKTKEVASQLTVDELLIAVGGSFVTCDIPESHQIEDGFSLVRILPNGTNEVLIGSFWPHQEAGSSIRVTLVPLSSGEQRIVVFTEDGTSIACDNKWGGITWTEFPQDQRSWGNPIFRFYSNDDDLSGFDVIRNDKPSKGQFDLSFITVKPTEK